MKLARGRIENYFKYIGILISFFYSMECSWVSAVDKIPWRFPIPNNNLCPFTPQVSYMWCQTRWLWACFMYLWKGPLYLALPLCQLLCKLAEKLERLTILYARFCNRSIPTLCNKLTPGKGMASTPKVKFELHRKVHLSICFSSFVSVLIHK